MYFGVLIVSGLLFVVGSRGETCEFTLLKKFAEYDYQISLLNKRLGATQAEQTRLLEKSSMSTYTRWGRKECPTNATLVYEGYAAGSHFTHSGAAANYLCLPSVPNWESFVDGFQSYGRIHGAEYETSMYTQWKYLHDHEAPCAVCRVPRDAILMVPGTNVCPQGFVLEYKGYLMTGAYSHAAASEYVCVDEYPEQLYGSYEDKNGKLFYHVEAVCGSLKCPPYVNGRELTCAVCSFSP